MTAKPLFRGQDGAPEPLRASVTRRVRFEEVDQLGIVWHGRYPGFFEDARVALTDAHDIGYLDFFDQGILTPLKQLFIDYRRPLHHKENFSIEAALHWSDAARLNFEYVIRNERGEVATTGSSVQLMLDLSRNILLVHPPFFQEFRERWKAGTLT